MDYDLDIESKICPDDALRAQFQNARTELVSRKSQEIISSRTLDMAHRLKQAGMAPNKLLSGFTVSWPDGLAKSCGMETQQKEVANVSS